MTYISGYHTHYIIVAFLFFLCLVTIMRQPAVIVYQINKP